MKNRSATYIFLLFLWSQLMNTYTQEKLEKNLK